MFFSSHFKLVRKTQFLMNFSIRRMFKICKNSKNLAYFWTFLLQTSKCVNLSISDFLYQLNARVDEKISRKLSRCKFTKLSCSSGQRVKSQEKL